MAAALPRDCCSVSISAPLSTAMRAKVLITRAMLSARSSQRPSQIRLYTRESVSHRSGLTDIDLGSTIIQLPSSSAKASSTDTVSRSKNTSAVVKFSQPSPLETNDPDTGGTSE